MTSYQYSIYMPPQVCMCRLQDIGLYYIHTCILHRFGRSQLPTTRLTVPLLQDSTAADFIFLACVFVFGNFKLGRCRLSGCWWVGLPGQWWVGLSGRQWVGLSGRRWVGLSGRRWVGLSGRRWVGLTGRRWVGLSGWWWVGLSSCWWVRVAGRRWVGWWHSSRIGLWLLLTLEYNFWWCFSSWLRGWGLCAFSLDHHSSGLGCGCHKVPADEKGPQVEPTARPAEANVSHSTMWPVVVEENSRSVTTTTMMMMMESMSVMMMESMTMMMESMSVMMNPMVVPVSPMASPAPPPSTPPLHNQLRLTIQDTHGRTVDQRYTRIVNRTSQIAPATPL